MAIKITMPQLGESVSEGVVGRWLKKVGDRVQRDEPLVEIITDKVNAEIPAVATGVLKQITVNEGETVAVGTEIAILEEDSASAPTAPDRPPPLQDTGGFFSHDEEQQPPLLSQRGRARERVLGPQSRRSGHPRWSAAWPRSMASIWHRSRAPASTAASPKRTFWRRSSLFLALRGGRGQSLP